MSADMPRDLFKVRLGSYNGKKAGFSGIPFEGAEIPVWARSQEDALETGLGVVGRLDLLPMYKRFMGVGKTGQVYLSCPGRRKIPVSHHPQRQVMESTVSIYDKSANPGEMRYLELIGAYLMARTMAAKAMANKPR